MVNEHDQPAWPGDQTDTRGRRQQPASAILVVLAVGAVLLTVASYCVVAIDGGFDFKVRLVSFVVVLINALVLLLTWLRRSLSDSFIPIALAALIVANVAVALLLFGLPTI